MMPRVVLATCLQWPDLSASDALYAAALSGLGMSVGVAPWNGPFEPFQSAVLVVLRSTWDYHYAPDQFRDWLLHLEREAGRVCNPPRLVKWNLDKSYLLDLWRQGVPIPKTDVVANTSAALAEAFDRMELDRGVVKPVIGASGHNVQLLSRQDIVARADEEPGPIKRLIVQEFVPEVQQTGELSCVFFDGQFSHALVKRPETGEYRVNSQYHGSVVAAEPHAAVVAQARKILSLLPVQPLYARIDGVVREGTFLLMELELVEPSLYLQHADGAARRFAVATVHRVSGR